MNEVYEIVKSYTSFNWSLIPIIPETKKPAIKWRKFTEKRAEFSEVKTWLDRGWWLAVVTGDISGILIIDDDRVKNGLLEWGFDSEIVAKTKSGGKHYYRFYDREVHSHSNSELRIDLKAWHSYCLLPPFNSREWIKAPTVESINKLAPVSSEELRLINSNKLEGIERHESLNMADFLDIPEGSRENDLYQIACSIFTKTEKEAAIKILLGINQTYEPPIEKDRFEYTITRAWNFVETSREKERSESQHIYNSDQATFTKAKHKQLEFISFKDLRNTEFPPNKWIVNGLIPDNGITIISGQPKSGKSFLTLDLGISLATGKNFLGEFGVQKTGILLISKEDPQRLINERIKQLTDEEDLAIEFCTENQLFLDTNEYIDEILKRTKEKGIKVIIIDSFRRIFKGDENSSQVVSEVHNRFKTLINEGLTIIFVHHHGKEGFFKKSGPQKLRGSSDILAMVDCLLSVEKKDGGIIKIKQEALRIDKEVPPFIVKFPTFEGEDRTFQFVEHIEEEKEKIELAKESILEFLEKGEANQTTIIESFKDSGIGKTTIKNAIKSLVEDGKIVVRQEGTKKFYCLILTPVTSEDPLREEFWNVPKDNA